MNNANLKAAEPAEETVDIPLSALVRCPLVEFRMRAVMPHCGHCEHFAGLADRFPGSAHLRFTQRFMVRCAAEPVRRELVELEVGT